MITVLAFLLALAILIVVHEWGHYAAARACGVRVLRFSVGFGRVVLRRMHGDTEFVVSALPLGGYVRMLDEREGPVDPALLGQAFNRKSLLQRAFIVAAGPVANLVLAVLLYAATFWIGQPEPQPVLATPVPGSLAEKAGLAGGDRVLRLRVESSDGWGAWQDIETLGEVRWQLMQAALGGQRMELETRGAKGSASGAGLRHAVLPLDQLHASDADAALMRRIGVVGSYSTARIGAVRIGGPADESGLQAGDVVLRIDGRPVADAQQLRERIRASGLGAPAAATLAPQQWDIVRGGEPATVSVRPRVVADGGQTVGRIEAEVGGTPALVTVRADIVQGLERGLQRTWELASLSVRMLGRMLVGQASVKNLSGPLSIADSAGQSAQLGFVPYLAFLAMVSVSLGVLNLLPLPMLDGGHLIGYIFEGLTGHPISERWQARLQRGGVAFLLLLMSVALYNDVARLLGLH